MVKKIIYECILCNISTHLKTDFKRHINTMKHQNTIKNCEDLEGQLKNLKYVNPIDSQMTPIDSQMTPIDSQMTPIDSQMTPIDSQMTPIDSEMTPIDSEMTPTELKMIYKCKFCKQSYSKNSNLHRHMKKCIKNTKNETVSLTTDESNDNEAKLSEYIKVIEKENKLIKRKKKDIEKENKLIKKEKKAMGKEIEKLLDKVGNVTNNNNMLQQNIIINNYGNENLDYLTEGYLTNLLKIPWGSVLTLLKDIHFNVNHPENHNVKIPNRKEKFAIVYRNGEWEIRMKKEVISSMVDMSYNIVECYFEDNKMILSDTKRNNFIEFQTNYDNGNLKKMIEGDLEVALLNN